MSASVPPHRWWQQPLFHFVVIGAVLFAVYQWRSSQPTDDARTVVVDRESLLEYMQYRAKFFDPEQSQDMLDNLGDEELRKLIDDYVREEILYREAVALGLNRNDFIIRQRVIQKLEFINRDLSVETTQLSDAEVRGYFEEHRDDYFDPPHVTFTHVFFNREMHGDPQAQALAEQKLAELNAMGVPFHIGPRHGDRFYYQVNYVERGRPEVASHFGPMVTDAVFSVEPSETLWYGPYESEYGFHVIMLAKRVDGRLLELDETYDRVADDARREMIKAREKAVIDGIIDIYDVKVLYQRPNVESGAAATEPTGP